MFISSGLCRRSPEISLEIARDVVRSVDTGYEPHLTARWRATSNAPADQAGGLLRAGDVATHRACRGATKWVQILARGARQRTSKSRNLLEFAKCLAMITIVPKSKCFIVWDDPWQ